jgi:hypothetical protein
MENITFFVERYGVIAVVLNVFLDEGGLPLPSYPLLAVAGALSVGGRPQLVLVLVAALCATVLADNTWYWIARRHGRKVLAQLCRITVSPDNCIRKRYTGRACSYHYGTPLVCRFCRMNRSSAWARCSRCVIDLCSFKADRCDAGVRKVLSPMLSPALVPTLAAPHPSKVAMKPDLH